MFVRGHVILDIAPVVEPTQEQVHPVLEQLVHVVQRVTAVMRDIICQRVQRHVQSVNVVMRVQVERIRIMHRRPRGVLSAWPGHIRQQVHHHVRLPARDIMRPVWVHAVSPR